MNKQYIDKLVKIAQELEEMMKPVATKDPLTRAQQEAEKAKFNAKLTYLIGYITALEGMSGTQQT